jgi:AraC-like DNA-binding protein
MRPASIETYGWQSGVVSVGSVPGSRLAFGEHYAVYRGPIIEGKPHRHAAFQIAIGVDTEVAVVDGAGIRHRGSVLVIPPMTRHALMATHGLVMYLIDPHCVFADGLRQRCADQISVVSELGALQEHDIVSPGRAATLDQRLVEAMTILASEDVALPAVAAMVGLSPQRLRALARMQLGIPLARWRMWSRLRRAAEQLQAGQSLADAADASGFADQAHLTRQMREMMGLTPKTIAPVVRRHGALAT